MAYYVFCDDDCKHEGMSKAQILEAIEAAMENGYVADPGSAVFSRIKEIFGNSTLQFWLGTEAEFNAINPAPVVQRCVIRLAANGMMYLCSDDSTLDGRVITSGTGDPSGGEDGDIYIKYE